MSDEIIGSPKIVASADTRAASDGLKELGNSGDRASKILQFSFDQVSRSSKQAENSIRALGASVTGSGASQKFQDLAVAIERAGGVSALSGKQLDLLREKIRQLEDAGGKVPASLHGIVVEASKLQEVTKDLGSDKLKELAGSFGPVGSALSAIGPAGLVAAAAIGAIVENVSKFAEFAHEVEHLKTQTGLTTTTIQEMKFASGAAGQGIEGLTGLVGKMDVALEKGSPGFEKLGLDFRELRNESPDEALHKVMEALRGVGSEQEKIAIGREIFGKQFQAMLPMIEGLERLKTVAHDAGLVLGEEDVEAGARLAEGWNELKLMGEGLSNVFAAGLVKGSDFRSMVEDATPAVALFASGLRMAGEAAAFTLKYLNPFGMAATAAMGVGRQMIATREYLTGTPLETPGIGGSSAPKTEAEYRGHAPKSPFAEPSEIRGPSSSQATLDDASGGKDLDRQTSAHLKALAEEATAKKEQIALDKELAEATAGVAAGLEGEIRGIQAKAAAHRESIELQAQENTAIAATKTERLAEVDQIEAARIASARAAAARKTDAEVIAHYAAAQKLANDTIAEGLSPLEQEVQHIQASAAAKVEDLQLGLQRAFQEGRYTEELRKSVEAEIAATNAKAKGDVVSVEHANSLKVEAASIAGVDEAEKALASVMEQTSHSMASRIAKINAERDASIRAAEEKQKAGKITQDALDKETDAYNRAADAKKRYAMQQTAASDLQSASAALSAVGDLGQMLGLRSDSKAGRSLGAIQQTLGGAGEVVHGAMSGDIGSVISGVIHGAMGDFNLVKSLLGGKSGTDKAMDSLIQDFGRAGAAAGHKWSEELAKAIEADAKANGGNMHAAELKNLPKIIQEAGGVTAFGAGRATNALGDMFLQLKQGNIDLKDVKTSFDAIFGDVAAANISKTTGIANSQLKGLVQLARQFNIESPALTEYLKGQSSSLVGNLAGSVAGMKNLRDTVGGDAGRVAERQTRNQLKDSGLSDDEIEKRVQHAGTIAANAAAAGVGIVSQRAATALASSVVGTFDELMKEGLSRGDALKEIGPVVKSMQDELIAAGYNGGQAFDELQGTIAVVSGEITGPMVAGIDSVTGALVNMNNLNMLNQDTVSGLTEQIGANIAALAQQGVEGPAAVAALQPDLQKIWELEQDFGYQVDASTQKLIDEGVASGAVGEKHRSASDQMVDGMKKVEDAVDRVAAAILSLDGKTAKVHIDTVYSSSGSGAPPGGAGGTPTKPGATPPALQPGDPGFDPYSDTPAFAEGTDGFQNFGKETLVRLHGWEMVTPLADADAAMAAAKMPSSSSWGGGMSLPSGGGSSGNMSVNLGGVTIQIHGAGDPQATADAVASALIDGVAGRLETVMRERTIGTR